VYMRGYVRTVVSEILRKCYVLSGGAATGFCHLGMIESLEKEGEISPTYVIGHLRGAALFAGPSTAHSPECRDAFRARQLTRLRRVQEFERKVFRRERKPADGHVPVRG